MLHGATIGSSDDSPSPSSNPFSNLLAAVLWLFDAALGSFHFEDVSNTKYPACGTFLLIAFLMVVTIILLNFLIAILTKTYEDHVQDSKRLFLLDIASDALELPFQPDIQRLPMMPRPANLVNIAVFLALHLLKVIILMVLNLLPSCCFCQRPSHPTDPRAAAICEAMAWWERAHIRAQLTVALIFGNFLVVILNSLLTLALLPLVSLATLFLSPFLSCCCLANMLNGSLCLEWARARKLSVKAARKIEESGNNQLHQRHSNSTLESPTASLGMNLMPPALRTFLYSLRPGQKFVLKGPFMLLLLLLLSEFRELVRWLPFASTVADYIDSLPTEATLGQLDVVFLKGDVVRTALRGVFCMCLLGGVMECVCLVVAVFSMFRCAEGPLQRGWRVLVEQVVKPRTESEEESEVQAYSAMRCRPDASDSDDEPVTDNTGQEENEKIQRKMQIARSPTHFLNECNQCGTNGVVHAFPLSPCSGSHTPAASSSHAHVTRLSVDAFMMHFTECCEAEATGGQPQRLRPLILQALDMVYAGKVLSTTCISQLAPAITLEDWYRLACSMIWCMREGRAELVLIDERFSQLSAKQSSMLRAHPQMSLYILQLAHTSGFGVAYEDFFWAVWNGFFGRRHLRVQEINEVLSQFSMQHGLVEGEETDFWSPTSEEGTVFEEHLEPNTNSVAGVGFAI